MCCVTNGSGGECEVEECKPLPEPTPPLDVFSVRCSRCSSVKVFDIHQGRYTS